MRGWLGVDWSAGSLGGEARCLCWKATDAGAVERAAQAIVALSLPQDEAAQLLGSCSSRGPSVLGTALEEGPELKRPLLPGLGAALDKNIDQRTSGWGEAVSGLAVRSRRVEKEVEMSLVSSGKAYFLIHRLLIHRLLQFLPALHRPLGATSLWMRMGSPEAGTRVRVPRLLTANIY